MVDLFFGPATQLSLISAYTNDALIADADDWSMDGMVYALYAQHTLGRNDVGLLLGEIRGDEVIGLTLASYIGPVGVHSDVTYTLPVDPDDEDPFVRAVLGGMWAATPKLTITSEVYQQTVGSPESDGYLSALESERHQRGELWLVGTTYGSVSVSYELGPLVQANTTWLANLVDGSALLVPGVTFSVSDEVQVVVGGFMGLGERPDEVDILNLIDAETGLPLGREERNSALGVNDEFGLYPSSAHVQMKAYF